MSSKAIGTVSDAWAKMDSAEVHYFNRYAGSHIAGSMNI